MKKGRNGTVCMEYYCLPKEKNLVSIDISSICTFNCSGRLF